MSDGICKKVFSYLRSLWTSGFQTFLPQSLQIYCKSSERMIERLLLAVLLVGTQVVNANFATRRVGRLRIEQDEEDTKRGIIERCLKLRGGVTEESGDGKVKGTCIGIDLGTTYRYVIFFDRLQSLSIKSCHIL